MIEFIIFISVFYVIGEYAVYKYVVAMNDKAIEAEIKAGYDQNRLRKAMEDDMGLYEYEIIEVKK